MKAIAVIPFSRQVTMVDHPPPMMGSPTDVTLRMLEVGVCGTDREISQFEYGTPPTGSPYLVLGHESLAEIVEVGSDVATHRVGELAVVMVRRPCTETSCRPCRSQRQDFCITGRFRERGIKEAHGFMTELVVEDERYVVPVPNTLRDVAVLVEPLTITEKALAQLEQIRGRIPLSSAVQPSDSSARRAVVLGAGPVGLLGAMNLVAAGYQTVVYSRDRPPNVKAEVVAQIGATYVSSQVDTVEQLAERVGNIDVVFEAAGSNQAAFNLARALGTNGVFIFTGVPALKGPSQVETDRLMKTMVLKNQVFLGTVNAGRQDFESAVGHLQIFTQRWPQALKAVVTKRYPMSEFHDVVMGKTGGIKEVITIG